MTLRRFTRQHGLVALAVACLGASGCSTLNEWKGPNEDPFFSVLDEPRVTTPTGPKTFAGAKTPTGNSEPEDVVVHTCRRPVE